MEYALPTLSRNGFVKDENIAIGKIFEYFKTTEYSQSNTYNGKLSSLNYLIQTYGTDSLNLQANVTSTLTTLYLSYYPKVDISVRVVENGDSGAYNLSIDISCTGTDGKEYTLNEYTSVDDVAKIDDKASIFY